MLCCGLSVRLFSISKYFGGKVVLPSATAKIPIDFVQGKLWALIVDRILFRSTIQQFSSRMTSTKDLCAKSGKDLSSQFGRIPLPILAFCRLKGAPYGLHTIQRLRLFHQLSIPPFTEKWGKIHIIWLVHKKLIDTSIENKSMSIQKKRTVVRMHYFS